MINGTKRFCFLVKKGDANDIVIDYDSLASIDLKRLSGIEAQGGEMMRVMRDTVLDNGVNALVMYKDLLRTIPVEKKKEKVSDENIQTTPENSVSTTEAVESAPVTVKKKRGRKPRAKV